MTTERQDTRQPALSRSREEMAEAVRRLSRESRTRLLKAAAVLGQDLSEEPDDLLQEALFRTLAGIRKCPVGMEVPVFLHGVIRSLASAARKRGGAVRFVPLDDEPGAEPSELSGTSAETGAARKRLLDLFRDDWDARFVVEARLEGLRGVALLNSTGLSRKQLDATMRRIRRRVERARKDGT